MDSTNKGDKMTMQEKIDRAYTQSLAAEIALRRLMAKIAATAKVAA
jgi:hypothetical protein